MEREAANIMGHPWGTCLSSLSPCPFQEVKSLCQGSRVNHQLPSLMCGEGTPPLSGSSCTTWGLWGQITTEDPPLDGENVSGTGISQVFADQFRHCESQFAFGKQKLLHRKTQSNSFIIAQLVHFYILIYNSFTFQINFKLQVIIQIHSQSRLPSYSSTHVSSDLQNRIYNGR